MITMAIGVLWSLVMAKIIWKEKVLKMRSTYVNIES